MPLWGCRVLGLKRSTQAVSLRTLVSQPIQCGRRVSNSAALLAHEYVVIGKD
jgi:hypothetical protein